MGSLENASVEWDDDDLATDTIIEIFLYTFNSLTIFMTSIILFYITLFYIHSIKHYRLLEPEKKKYINYIANRKNSVLKWLTILSLTILILFLPRLVHIGIAQLTKWFITLWTLVSRYLFIQSGNNHKRYCSKLIFQCVKIKNIFLSAKSTIKVQNE